ASITAFTPSRIRRLISSLVNFLICSRSIRPSVLNPQDKRHYPDATGWIVLSKEMLKKKDGRYLLVNPTYDFDRVAVPLQQVLQEAGSYFRDVFLVSVGFY
ncbi:MAG: hypothetical protein AB1751_05490, partial [Acidobacteriota bacterium]